MRWCHVQQVQWCRALFFAGVHTIHNVERRVVMPRATLRMRSFLGRRDSDSETHSCVGLGELTFITPFSVHAYALGP
jgi:hypothetical protein